MYTFTKVGEMQHFCNKPFVIWRFFCLFLGWPVLCLPPGNLPLAVFTVVLSSIQHTSWFCFFLLCIHHDNESILDPVWLFHIFLVLFKVLFTIIVPKILSHAWFWNASVFTYDWVGLCWIWNNHRFIPYLSILLLPSIPKWSFIFPDSFP